VVEGDARGAGREAAGAAALGARAQVARDRGGAVVVGLDVAVGVVGGRGGAEGSARGLVVDVAPAEAAERARGDVEARAGGAGQRAVGGGQLVAATDLAHVQVGEAGDAGRGGLAGRAVTGQAGSTAAAGQPECE